MSEKCQTGCMVFHGGEISHHKDCVFYPESLSEMMVSLQSENEQLKTFCRKLVDALGFYGGKHARQVLSENEKLIRELLND